MNTVKNFIRIGLATAIYAMQCAAAPFVSVPPNAEDQAEMDRIQASKNVFAQYRKLPKSTKRRFADYKRQFDPEKRLREQPNDPGLKFSFTALIALEDEITIDYLINEAKRGDMGINFDIINAFSSSLCANAVPVLMRWASIDEPYKNWQAIHGDLFYPLYSFHATEVIGSLVSRCEEFPPSVREWMANNTRNSISTLMKLGSTMPEEERKNVEIAYEMERREIVRDWYKANERAFAESRYHDVKPGIWLSECSGYLLPYREMWNAIELSELNNAATRIDPSPAEKGSALPIDADAKLAAAPNPPADNIAWLIGGAISAILAVGVIIKRSLRKQG